MKPLLVLIVGLLSVGCATLTPEEKQKRLRDSVVGEYERGQPNKHMYKQVLLRIGIVETYANGWKDNGGSEWSIVDGEIHIKYDSRLIYIWRINKDKSISQIAYLRDVGGGLQRTDYPKTRNYTYKKIK